MPMEVLTVCLLRSRTGLTLPGAEFCTVSPSVGVSQHFTCKEQTLRCISQKSQGFVRYHEEKNMCSEEGNVLAMKLPPKPGMSINSNRKVLGKQGKCHSPAEKRLA